MCIHRLCVHIYVCTYIYLYVYFFLHIDICAHIYNTNRYIYIRIVLFFFPRSLSLMRSLSLCPSPPLHSSVSPALSLSNPLSLPPCLHLSLSPLSLFLLPAVPLSQTHFLFLSLSRSLALARTLSRATVCTLSFVSGRERGSHELLSLEKEVTKCCLDLCGKVGKSPTAFSLFLFPPTAFSLFFFFPRKSRKQLVTSSFSSTDERKRTHSVRERERKQLVTSFSRESSR